MASKATSGVALVTGAAGGIGRDTVFSFAESGAVGIILADLDSKGAQDVAEASKKYATHPKYRTVVVAVNVADPSSVQAMVDMAVKEFGRIDYSVHSAGIGVDSYASIIDSSADELMKVSEVNAKGTMLCVRAVAQIMSKQESLATQGRYGSRSLGRGSIINIGSALSHMAMPGALTYTTSKHAVLGITKTAALDLAPHSIRVNVVCPSWVNTPMMTRDFEKAPILPDMIKKASPLGRMAEPDEISDLIVFLCSPAASYINGTGLIVDSGVTLSLNLD